MATTAQRLLRPTESQFAVSEVIGDAPVIVTGGEYGVEAGAHEEVASPEGSESIEEYIEATPAQLAAESGEETAQSDLRGIEGFEPQESSEEGRVAESPLREVGSGTEGGQEEFFPILAALAPTLISTIGPAVAKQVMGRLSPRAKRLIRRLPRPAQKAVSAVTKNPAPSGNIRGLIARLLETAEQQPGGESGAEVDEAFVEEAVAAIEFIIGTDDRVRITQTTQVPWRRICALRITFPSGAVYRGTGFLVGPRAVVTAGHCVYLHNQGGWARTVEVIPACNGTLRPFGQVLATSFRSVGGWVNGKKPESDYGCIVLPPGAFGGKNLGSFGFASFATPVLLAQPAVVAGYPGDKPFAELWGMARKIKAVTAKTFVYDIDTMGGQSGAPVYIKRNGQRYVVGIHNYGAISGNSATRVTQEVYQRLLNWSKI
jgi:V8-like Glu-specific endopeptidase